MDNVSSSIGPSQPVNPINQQPQTQEQQDQKPTLVAPSNPVSLSQKEQAPISSKDSLPSEVITPSEQEPRLDHEVQEAGVKQVSDRFPLTDAHKEVGIEHAKESTPVPAQPKSLFTKEEAEQIIKATKPENSIFGLAMLVLKYVKRTMLGK